MSNSRGSVVGPVIPLMALHGAGPIRRRVPDTLECLARLAADGNHPHATRLLGAAESMRQRTGQVRFPMYQAGYDAVVRNYAGGIGAEWF
jgi:hypothetical protein